MRMSRSPQNGGFHKCSGGGPFFPARFTSPAMASRPVFASAVFESVVFESAMRAELAHDLAIVQSLRYPNSGRAARANAMCRFGDARRRKWPRLKLIGPSVRASAAALV